MVTKRFLLDNYMMSPLKERPIANCEFSKRYNDFLLCAMKAMFASIKAILLQLRNEDRLTHLIGDDMLGEFIVNYSPKEVGRDSQIKARGNSSHPQGVKKAILVPLTRVFSLKRSTEVKK